MPELKAIPIGKEDFKEIIDDNCYFVDKTLLIRDIIDSGAKVSLFTRPRRFGKTLNMSMLRRYFEKTEQDNSYLFNGLKISQAGEKYLSHLGQYPVICISLKSMKQPDFNSAFEEFKKIVSDEVRRHSELLSSEKIFESDKEEFLNICNRKGVYSTYNTALKFLSDRLYEVHGKKVIVLIDEYDVPLENAYFNGFYDEMISLIRSVFESVLKTNDSLEFAVLTGCLRISKESIFTGLNNLKVYTVLDNRFSQYFGFTEDEVKSLLSYYALDTSFDELKKWYDGYKFGKTEIYNPWSVLQYVDNLRSGNDLAFAPYWINTSSNSIIHELITQSDRRIRDDIEKLITGKSIEKPLYDDITYVNMNVKSEYIWSFLLHTGYLKPKRCFMKGIQNYCEAVIPNMEIISSYENTFRQWFDESIRSADKSKLLEAVLAGDAENFQLEVNRWLLRSISYHDGYENFYHGFLVGLLEYNDDYLVESNRESGMGRSDIIIKNVLMNDKAVVIEIKTVRDDETPEEQCDAALNQIEEKQYEENLRNEGFSHIIKYGVAFNGKKCMVKLGK